MFASIFASLLAMATVQSADDLEAACQAYQAEYGGESDCSCLAEKAAGDEDLLAAFNEIQSPEDLADAPSEVMEAIEDCS
ncbi:hypothetical protein [Parvularcula lutaonensis]|uniref:Uncharacterized protein n=1 Tax=Parvularcula lutaonensis TaxID=491923 RepID=A0ABV7ME08_9PROT|nr:hypothetical protein [Parvularcula lutaonensis]GGY51707.1 hypothetical protein GCM10007148_20790 [Parvularcula lutaonensis]